MFICMFTLGVMDLRLHEPRQIGEEDLAEAAPRVRALVLERLEQIWSTVAPHVDGTIAAEDGRSDPRFVEAGIRVLDRLSKLYRLDAPMAQEKSTGVVIDSRVLVEGKLAEIEARMN